MDQERNVSYYLELIAQSPSYQDLVFLRNRTFDAVEATLPPEEVETIKQAWLFASAERGESRVRSGYLLWAMLAEEDIGRKATASSSHLAKIDAAQLKRDFDRIAGDQDFQQLFLGMTLYRRRQLFPPLLAALHLQQFLQSCFAGF